MPTHRCKHPTCATALPDGRKGYCAAHEPAAVAEKALVQNHYDKHARDPRAKKFYGSAAWGRCRATKLAATPVCQRCTTTFAEHVHHVKPIAKFWELRLDQKNLRSLCTPCHNIEESQSQRIEPDRPHVAGMLELVEDDEFYYDDAAGERPVRFIEKHCCHYEGAHAGNPFLLEDVQKKFVRDIFGWKSKRTGYRRFSQVWIEAAVGMGKSPLLAAIGLYCLGWDAEPAAQIFSLGANTNQGRIVFDTAKRFIESSAQLSAHLVSMQNEIRHHASKSWWKVISGKGSKAGMRPYIVLGDEIHEWAGRQVYDSLQGRMTKRTQPIFFCATNAGESRQSICWQLHEEAAAVLKGESRNKGLYPVIFAAPKHSDPKLDSDPASPASWKLANPLLGITIKPEKVLAEWMRSQGNPALEARFRRLYLSQWVQGSNKWLSMTLWDACTQKIDVEKLKEVPLYLAIDMSLGDDLCAAVKVWISPETIYVVPKFWLPRETADHYQEKDAIPFREWADAGHIKLLEETTISDAVRKRIGEELVEDCKRQKPESVGYDRYKADDVVAALEGDGHTCVPIAQGYTVSPGCHELERRLKERSVIVDDNPVMRMCAENVEVKGDDRGNIWPVKPNAKGKYAGKRSAKIDGVVALVTALTEARKHKFPENKKRNWKGGVWVI